MRFKFVITKILYVMKRKISPFYAAVAAVLAVTVTVIIFAAACAGSEINFKTTFYFVCYSVSDNAVSAGSFSEAVSSYGGAGYVLEYGEEFYVTVACYYKETDAEAVCRSLRSRQLDCNVLKVITESYRLNALGGANRRLYKGNLNTLFTLSSLAYECANGLDTGEYSQSEAKGVISDMESGLKGLLTANPDNCFSPHIKRLLAECAEAKSGIIYSKNLRKIQIAAADVIINVRLY